MHSLSAIRLIAFVSILTCCASSVSAQDVSQQDVQRWKSQLRDPAASYRAQAAVELANLGPAAHSAIEDLYVRLDDIDANVRRCAIHALGSIAYDYRTAERLLPKLDDQDEHVRYAAEWAMARIASLAERSQHPAELHRVLVEAVTRVSRREHHVRHRRIVEQAIALLAVHARPATPVQAPVAPTPQEIARKHMLNTEAHRLQEWLQIFEQGDRVAQTQVIEALTTQPEDADIANFYQQCRAEVLKTSILRSELALAHYAMHRWQEHSQAAIGRLFAEFPTDAALPEWTTRVLYEFHPNTAADVSKLIAISQNSENPLSVRSAATDALGRSADSVAACFQTLLNYAGNINEDEFLRTDAIRSLASLYPHLNTDQRRTTHSSLVAILESSEDWSIKTSAAHALSKATPESYEALDSFYQASMRGEVLDYQLQVALEVVRGFRVSHPGVQLWIERALHSEDDATQQAGLSLLMSGSSDGLIHTPHLIALIADPDESAAVKKMAADAIDSLGESAVTCFAESLLECDGAGRVDAIYSLASMKERAIPAVPTLLALVKSTSTEPTVRNAAIYAIGQIGAGSKHSADYLFQLFHEDTPTPELASAIIALADLGALQSADLNEMQLAHSENVARAAMSYARFRMGDLTGLTHLIDQLGEDNPFVAAALLDIGQPAQPALINLLHDQAADPARRVAAMQILTQHPHETYQPLVATLSDPQIGDACHYLLADCTMDGGTALLGDLVRARAQTNNAAAQRRMDDIIDMMVTGVGAGEEEGSVVPAAFARLVRSEMERDYPINSAVEVLPVAPPSSTAIATGGSAGGLDSASPGSGLALNPPLTGEGAMPGAADSAAATSGSASTDWPDATEPLAVSEEAIADLAGGASADEATETNREHLTSHPADSATEDASASDRNPLRSFSTPTEPITRTNPFDSADLPENVVALGAGTDEPTSVRVFYGTNRRSLTTAAIQGPLSKKSENSKKAIALLTAIATVVICFFGFLRQRSLLYAVFAVSGMSIVVWLGMKHHLDKSAREVALAAPVSFGGELSQSINVGYCTVTIPPIHERGELESPSIFRLQFEHDPQQHVTLKKTEPLERNEFYQMMRDTMDRRGKQLLVFIHGYNVSFEDAARRTAQMAHDLDYPGAPVFYSWPSQANWYQYRLDRKNIELSVPQIKSFLIELAERSGAESINLVAHSMGSVGLTEALAEIEAQGQHRHFNQVVLAAPDIDADIFRTRIAPSIVEKANRCTLYASSSDLALVASKYFNAGSRAGDTENVSQDFSGIDVIDATNADTSFLGHSYYGNNHVLKDLSELLLDRPANRRTWLRSASTNGRNYWEFRGGQLAERVDSSPLVR